MKAIMNLKETQTRKVLANNIAVVLDTTAKYSGTDAVNGHRFAYQIGSLTLTKENELVGFAALTKEQQDALGDMFEAYGYECIGEDEPGDEGYGMVTLPEGPTVPRTEPDVTAEPASTTAVYDVATDTIREVEEECIWVPWMEPDETAKLEAIVAAKHDLICKAIGKDPEEGLYFRYGGEGEQIGFPWFTREQIEYNGEEYMRFVKALCDLAANVHRVTAKPHPVPNEKYAFRVFLLRLGFIGPEYAKARKLLLANLTGNGAFRQPKEVKHDEK